MDAETKRMYDMGLRFIDRKLYGNALFYFDKAIAISPREPELWLEKGRALASMNRFDESLMCFDNAISLNPGLEKAWIAKGLALHCQGNLEYALDCFDRAIEITNGRSDEAWYAKGVVLFLLHRYREALMHFERALDIFPFHKNAALFKKDCLKRLREEGEGDDLFDLGPETTSRSRGAVEEGHKGGGGGKGPRIVASRSGH